MVNLWQSGRDGMQGAFLQPIAGLWAKKATQQTARDRLITEHRELFRGSLEVPAQCCCVVPTPFDFHLRLGCSRVLVAKTKLRAR